MPMTCYGVPSCNDKISVIRDTIKQWTERVRLRAIRTDAYQFRVNCEAWYSLGLLCAICFILEAYQK